MILLEKITERFDPKAAEGLNAVYLFKVTEAGNYALSIKDGTCSVEEVKDPQTVKADVTLKANAEVWEAIFNGSMAAQMAFMLNKLEVQGDLPLALKLTNIFAL